MTEESSVIAIVTPAPCGKYTSPAGNSPANLLPAPIPTPAQRKAALREFLACLCMPTHHYNHISIRTQFLGQVLAALLAACSQQIAWVCDLLVETGRRKCCRDAGGEAASCPGMNWSHAVLAWPLTHRLMWARHCAVFFTPFSPASASPFVFSCPGPRQVLPLTCQSCAGPPDKVLGTTFTL